MKFNILFSLIALLFLTISCEKVIDVDLNVANPKPVFESYIENDSVCYVKATWTSSYYDNSPSPVIPNATISISDQNGNSETLTYEGDGIYRGVSLLGTIGNTYTLSIQLDGNNYTAKSYMSPLTSIDSLTLQPSGFFGGGQQGPPKFWVFVNYKDSADYANYYAVITHRYDSTEQGYIKDYRIADDDVSDGIKTRTFTTFARFERGDSLFVEFASIDYHTHLYFKTLEDAVSGAGFASAAPANPTTNIKGGALGYFGAWSKDTMSFVVP